MKYAFIASHTGEFSIQRMYQVLQVDQSGYYAWSKRPVYQREQANQELVVKIRRAHQMAVTRRVAVSTRRS